MNTYKSEMLTLSKEELFAVIEERDKQIAKLKQALELAMKGNARGVLDAEAEAYHKERGHA